MKRCCGEKRSTAFCPDCGKKLHDEPLPELLVHARRQQKAAANAADRKRHRAKHDKHLSDFYERRAEKADEVSRKWKRWADALEKIIVQAKSDGGNSAE